MFLPCAGFGTWVPCGLHVERIYKDKGMVLDIAPLTDAQ